MPSTYDWLSLVHAVSETCLYNFTEVFNMPAEDFLAYLGYVNEKRARERDEILKAKGSTKLA